MRLSDIDFTQCKQWGILFFSSSPFNFVINFVDYKLVFFFFANVF